MKQEPTAHNEIIGESKVSILPLLLEQLRSPLIYILLFAGFIALWLEEYSDALIILLAVAVNTVLGFYQEYKAENTLNKLRQLIVPKAIVIRDGVRHVIEAKHVHTGDTVELNIDFQIPADGILLHSKDISVSESLLTGESMPIYKHTGDEIFAGTRLLTGTGEMIVNATGTRTKIGNIGQKVSNIVETKTPLQTQLSQLASFISVIVVIAAVALFAIGASLNYDPASLFRTAVAVSVAAIPEGLLITLTVILAIGMQRISQRKAVVRKLLAAETLGSVTTICVDKTGTITEGNLKVVGEDVIDQRLAHHAIILSNNQVDPLELAMDKWLKEQHADELTRILKETAEYKQLDRIPFHSNHKFAAGLYEIDGKRIILVLGAPEILQQRSTQSSDEQALWDDKRDSYANKANRLVGLAYKYIDVTDKELTKEDIVGLTWNGLMIFDDPVRVGIEKVFNQCKSARIEVKMITGDYRQTAKAVAESVGLIEKGLAEEDLGRIIMTQDELAGLSEAELKQRIPEVVIFARTDPFQKLRIVNALKELGKVVAMTGDGVNDSPALKAADIGVVVNEASDVSKETADIVLLDSNMSTIVHAVEEGRAIFDNIQKVVLYLLSDSFSELILVMGSIVLQMPLPITAVQILWINLIEDSLPALSLAFEPKEPDLMNYPPRPREAAILDRRLKTIISTFVMVTGFLLLAIVYYMHQQGVDLVTLQTFAFIALGLNSLLYIFACKSLRHSNLNRRIFNNKLMLGAVGIGVVLLFLGAELPILNNLLGTIQLPIGYWAIAFVFGIINLLVIESVKRIARRSL